MVEETLLGSILGHRVFSLLAVRVDAFSRMGIAEIGSIFVKMSVSPKSFSRKASRKVARKVSRKKSFPANGKHAQLRRNTVGF